MKQTKPITIFVASGAEALRLAQLDEDSRALCTGPGTLNFHKLIAEHGAGAFRTLYVAQELRASFKLPAGGEVLFNDGLVQIVHTGNQK